TPTSGTTKIRVRMVGGGGSGGSVAAAGTGEAASGGGGGSGAYGEGIFTSGFSGAAVTVGAGGAAPAAGNNNGNAGGTTSLGVLISAPGGSVGLGSPAFATPFATGAGEQSSAPAG